MRRIDMMRIQTDDGTVWDSSSELVSQHGPDNLGAPYEDVELMTSQMTRDAMEHWLRRVGKHVSFLATILTPRGMPESSIAVAGKVKTVALSSYDSNEQEMAVDRLIITPTNIVPL